MALAGDAGGVVSQAERRAARAKADEIASLNDPKNDGYKIGHFDVIEVSVFKVAELSKPVQVSETGTINYPLIGELEVAGNTPRDVEKILTKALGEKYLQNPQVTVFVKEFNSQRVTIEGAVKKPGVYPMQGKLTLLQLVANSGGFDSLSDDEVVVFRSEGTKKTAARFSVSELRDGTAPDPKLKAGDVVIAGKSFLKEGFQNFMKVLPLAAVFGIL